MIDTTALFSDAELLATFATKPNTADGMRAVAEMAITTYLASHAGDVAKSLDRITSAIDRLTQATNPNTGMR